MKIKQRYLITGFPVFGLVMALVFPMQAFANAGTIVVSKHANKQYVLLVKTHKHDYFEFPGGKPERVNSLVDTKKKAESNYDAAIRETVEETRGYLGQRLLRQSSSPSKGIETGKYTLYLVKLPFFDLKSIRQIKLPNKKKWAPMLEIVDYAWVDVSLISQNGHRAVINRSGKKIILHDAVKPAIKAGKLKKWF